MLGFDFNYSTINFVFCSWIVFGKVLYSTTSLPPSIYVYFMIVAPGCRSLLRVNWKSELQRDCLNSQAKARGIVDGITERWKWHTQQPLESVGVLFLATSLIALWDGRSTNSLTYNIDKQCDSDFRQNYHHPPTNFGELFPNNEIKLLIKQCWFQSEFGDRQEEWTLFSKLSQ